MGSGSSNEFNAIDLNTVARCAFCDDPSSGIHSRSIIRCATCHKNPTGIDFRSIINITVCQGNSGSRRTGLAKIAHLLICKNGRVRLNFNDIMLDFLCGTQRSGNDFSLQSSSERIVCETRNTNDAINFTDLVLSHSSGRSRTTLTTLKSVDFNVIASCAVCNDRTAGQRSRGILECATCNRAPNYGINFNAILKSELCQDGTAMIPGTLGLVVNRLVCPVGSNAFDFNDIVDNCLCSARSLDDVFNLRDIVRRITCEAAKPPDALDFNDILGHDVSTGIDYNVISRCALCSSDGDSSGSAILKCILCNSSQLDLNAIVRNSVCSNRGPSNGIILDIVCQDESVINFNSLIRGFVCSGTSGNDGSLQLRDIIEILGPGMQQAHTSIASSVQLVGCNY